MVIVCAALLVLGLHFFLQTRLALAPSAAAIGETVTIRGSGFWGETYILFQRDSVQGYIQPDMSGGDEMTFRVPETIDPCLFPRAQGEDPCKDASISLQMGTYNVSTWQSWKTKYVGQFTVLPLGWIDHVDEQYQFAIAHPKEWRVHVSDIPRGQSADHALHVVSISPPETNGGYQVRVLDTTLETAVSFYKEMFKDNSSVRLFPEELIKIGSISGLKLTYEIRQKEPDSYTRSADYLLSFDGKVYVFSSVYEEDTMRPQNVEESKEIFETLRFLMN